MILHSDPLFQIYFGDSRSAQARQILGSICPQEKLWSYPELSNIKKIMHLERLALLNQIHSDLGNTICKEYNKNLDQLKPDGDYLITTLERTGLGVYTADCLPIIFYDYINHAIGICHAGWRGSAKQIAVKTVQKMKKDFGTDTQYIRVFFGPSAKTCCYEVTPDFKNNFESFHYSEQLFVTNGGAPRSSKLYFDLPLFNKLQLEEIGIKKESFHFTYNLCTICDETFCSSRREGPDTARQLTIVALK